MAKRGPKPKGKSVRIGFGSMFPEVASALRQRAQEEGLHMSDYVSELIARDAGAASVAELREREREGLAASA